MFESTLKIPLNFSFSSHLLLIENTWLNLIILIILSSVTHSYFKRHEPTFSSYISLLGISLSILTLLFKSFFIAFKIVCFLNLLIGIQILSYRLLWHELRNIPGPKFAALTQFWLLREAYLGRTRFTMKEVGEKYGDWVRIGPNELYTVSLNALWIIMGPKGWSKGSSYDSGITKDKQGGDSVLTLKTLSDHATRRRIWDKAFTPKAIHSYLPAIEARIDQLLAVLDRHALNEIPVDLCLQLGYFVYDFMTDMAFGDGTNLLINQDDEHKILNHMGRVVQQVGILRNVPWLTSLVNQLPNQKIKQQDRFREFTKSMFLRRYKKGLATEVDVFHYLLGEDSETGTKLSFSELVADSTLVIIAGADTTRTVMVALFLYLLRSPKQMKTLQNELSNASDLSPSSLSKIAYLDGCIKEALRLQPPSPANIQRITPDEGVMIDGIFIPGGTKVRMSNWAMQRDSRYFECPNSFWPERWIGTPSIAKPHNPKAFFPFMIGPGTCVAKNLAMMEMRLVIAHILINYDLQFAPGFDDLEFERSWTDAYLLLIESPFMVKLKSKTV
ncbi:cytochrome P450 [Melampsora americana]|nr:cytochrome P450 [Melampsora americana]